MSQPSPGLLAELETQTAAQVSDGWEVMASHSPEADFAAERTDDPERHSNVVVLRRDFDLMQLSIWNPRPKPYAPKVVGAVWKLADPDETVTHKLSRHGTQFVTAWLALTGLAALYYLFRSL
jgi:hypothetical protein